MSETPTFLLAPDGNFVAGTPIATPHPGDRVGWVRGHVGTVTGLFEGTHAFSDPAICLRVLWDARDSRGQSEGIVPVTELRPLPLDTPHRYPEYEKGRASA